MSVSARLEVDWSILYCPETKCYRQTTDRQTYNGVYRAARSQLKNTHTFKMTHDHNQGFRQGGGGGGYPFLAPQGDIPPPCLQRK